MAIPIDKLISMIAKILDDGERFPRSDSGGFPVSGKTLAVAGTGVAAVLAAPFVLPAVGFTAAGVAAGSLAASLQGSVTAAGSWFALAQSAGAAGLAASTKAAIGGIASSVTYFVYPSNCEAE